MVVNWSGIYIVHRRKNVSGWYEEYLYSREWLAQGEEGVEGLERKEEMHKGGTGDRMAGGGGRSGSQLR